MHHPEVSKNYHWLSHNQDSSIETPEEHMGKPVQHLGNRQREYEKLIQGCADYYGEKGYICYENEEDRIDMGLLQPQSMVNYTKTVRTKVQRVQLLLLSYLFSSQPSACIYP